MNEQRATFILSGDLDGLADGAERELKDVRGILVGSHAECELRLGEHFAISGQHARIEWDGEDFYLTDADPAHVTYVNQREAAYDEPVALAGGDIVQIGPYVLELESEGGARLRIKVSRLLVKSCFVIERAETDRTVDRIRYESEVLLVCNPADVEAGGSARDKLILNKSNVSPLHAGISRFKDPFDDSVSRFCLIHLSPSNATHLNGRLLRTDELTPLSNGDVAQIGPFDLTFRMRGSVLRIVVKLSVDDTAAPAMRERKTVTDASAPAQVVADALRIFWAKRTREKAARPSPLSPLQAATPERVGKVRYKWRPTTDLAPVWPRTLLLWGVVAPAVVFALVLAYTGLRAFSPRPLSAAHARASFSNNPAIAREPNADSCTTCHARGRSMETNCAECHRTETFTATVTAPHRAAGLGCVSCHAEHRGADFRPGVASLNADFQKNVQPEETCAGCHNDANQKLYQGRRVFTPHGGTFGYPVVNGRWKWKGVDAEALEQKPEEFKQQVANWPVASADEDGRRSAQFHALHLDRVRTTGTLTGVDGKVSCSTCHKSHGRTLDRETPRTTCAACHGGRTDARTGLELLARDAPDCTSCHTQHATDARRRHPMLAATLPAGEKGRP